MRYQILTMLNLHSYFNIKRKLDINANNESETVTKKQRDNKYDKVKRNRSFQDKWSEEFPWVTYEKDQMFCTLCMKFPQLIRWYGLQLCVRIHFLSQSNS